MLLRKDKEKIVGFQTDAPLKRGIMPNGGIRVVKNALDSYGYELDPTLTVSQTAPLPMRVLGITSEVYY